MGGKFCTAACGSKDGSGGLNAYSHQVVQSVFTESITPVTFYSSHSTEATFYLCIADWEHKQKLKQVH